MQITISLGITLCVDEKLRNFVKLGIEVQDIDLAGDVEAQATEALSASIKVIAVLDEGLQEELAGVVTNLTDAPELVHTALQRLNAEVAHIKGPLITNVVEKVKELEARIPQRRVRKTAASDE